MSQSGYQVHISSKRKLINFNFRELWQYRDLIFLFVRRDFVSRYKQTVLGPLWAIIRPVLTTVVFTVIFGNLANLTTLDVVTGEETRVPSFLFYMAGTICWSYFSSTLMETANTFIANRDIMGKVYFPRMAVPIATAFSNLISFFIQLGLFVIIWLVCMIRGGTTMHLTGFILLLPLIILQMMMLGTGFGIIISALTTKYRDLNMLLQFGVQLLQYGTPVAYGLSLIPESFLPVYLLNPVTIVITTFRCGFFGGGFFSGFYYAVSWVITLLVFFAGMLMFNYIEKTFMDTI